jgi:hypothetical protein
VVLRQVKNFKKLNIDVILANNIDKHKKIIIDQQKEQLKFGQGSDGKKITPEYASDNYAFDKNQQNSLAGFGTPDLNLSGDMYSGLDLLVGIPNDESYSIFSDVTYFNDLQDKYKTAFDLSSKSLKVVRPVINNDTLKDIHEFINK